jgi:hypothetical protein
VNRGVQSGGAGKRKHDEWAQLEDGRGWWRRGERQRALRSFKTKQGAHLVRRRGITQHIAAIAAIAAVVEEGKG